MITSIQNIKRDLLQAIKFSKISQLILQFMKIIKINNKIEREILNYDSSD